MPEVESIVRVPKLVFSLIGNDLAMVFTSSHTTGLVSFLAWYRLSTRSHRFSGLFQPRGRVQTRAIHSYFGNRVNESKRSVSD